jgi:hypothetical protein
MSNRRVKRIDELARDVPPVRDLWPGIAAAIEADRVAGAAPQQKTARRSFWMPAAGLAASVLLVAIGVFIGKVTSNQGQDVTARNTTTAPGIAAIPSDVRHAKYTNQREELLREVNAKLQTMPPADRAKVAASLETLSKSIKDIEAALGHDPANALLQELLVSSCQEEMRALTAVRDSGREEI